MSGTPRESGWQRAALGPYLEALFGRCVEVLEVEPLGGPDGEDVEGFGYGVPPARLVLRS